MGTHPELAVVNTRRVGQGFFIVTVDPIGVETREGQLRFFVGLQRVDQAVLAAAAAEVLSNQGQFQLTTGETLRHAIWHLPAGLPVAHAQVVDHAAAVFQHTQAFQREAVIAETELEVELLHGDGHATGHRADQPCSGCLAVEGQGLLQQDAEGLLTTFVGETVGCMAKQGDAGALSFYRNRHQAGEVLFVFTL